MEDKLEELKKKLEEYQKEKDEYLAGWQRARADFLNYKKEEVERIKEILKYGNENLILKILPILDNFEKAEREMKEVSYGEETKNLINGFLQIKTQFQDFLKNQGVEEMKSLGKKFDPNLHKATEMIKVEKEESGTIIEETQKGYTIHGRVLRPAKVKVTK